MDYAARQRNPGRHLVGIGLVVLLHVVLIYALITGLATKVIQVVKSPIETKIIKEVKPPPPEAPPPPPPKLAQPPPPYIPPPEVHVATPPPQNTITAISREKHPPPPPPRREPAPQQPVQVTGLSQRDLKAIHDALNKSFVYPPRATANGYEGTAVVRVVFKADGTILSVQVIKKTGYFVLDEAAKRTIERMGRFPILTSLPPGSEFVLDVPIVFKLSD